VIGRLATLVFTLAVAAPLSAQDRLGTGPAPGSASDVTLTHQTDALARSPRSQDLARQNHVLLYPFGQGQPRLICAPLRACHVELAAGETPLERSGGDLVRWLVSTIRGPAESWLIVVKPRYCDITTDLLVTTTRRIYSFILDSPPCSGADSTQLNPRLPYTSILRFYYPEEESAAFAADSGMRERDRAREVVPAPGTIRPNGNSAGRDVLDAPTGLNLGYEVRRDRAFPYVPDLVYDNGSELFIHLPPAASRQHDLPVLHEVSAAGAIQMIRYRFDPEHNVFRVAGVPSRVLLVIGSARGEEIRLLIERRRAR
jgi:type IV secretory pathway VirB9-like protein